MVSEKKFSLSQQDAKVYIFILLNIGVTQMKQNVEQNLK